MPFNQLLDLNIISIIIFIVILAVIIVKDRKKFEVESFAVLRRTKRGKEFLRRLGTRYPRFWKWFGNIAIPVGFFFAVLFILLLIDQLWLLYIRALPAIGGIILPSPTTTPVFGPGFIGIPFWHFIITIAVIFVVHESCHGILASREKVKIKSLGWFGIIFFPLLMGAFVEPDEKQMAKKKASSQLRILAVGSFSNFIFALISLIVFIAISMSLFSSAGVAFQGYPGQAVGIENITSINGIGVNGLQDIQSALGMFGSNTNLEFSVEGATLLATPAFVLGQLNQSNASVVLFDDLPSYRANLTGTIVKIGDFDIRTNRDLEMSLEAIGPGKSVRIVTRTEGGLNSFDIVTVPEPEPVFSPNVGTATLASMEQAIPGYIDLSTSVSNTLHSIQGLVQNRDWRVIQTDIQFWEYVGSEYPGIKERSEAKITELENELKDNPRAGFIGISQPAELRSIASGMEPYAPVLIWFQGLFLWLWLLNFFVGMFNMLPLWITDGGRMWTLVFQKVSKKHCKKIVNTLSLFSLALIIATFMFFFGLL